MLSRVGGGDDDNGGGRMYAILIELFAYKVLLWKVNCSFKIFNVQVNPIGKIAK